MKKGIIMEKHRRFTVIMQKDGIFHKALPIDDAVIGTEVSYQPMEMKKNYYFSGKKTRVPVRMLAMACLLLLLVVPFYFFNNTSNTYAYVSIDINPSIELEIDEKLKVQSITPLNDDAEILISQLTDFQGSKFEQVIDQIMSKSEKEGLTANGKNILIGVSYVPDEPEVSALDSIDNHFVTNESGWKVATFQVPGNIRDTAMKNKQSVNEFMASNVIESIDSSKESTKIQVNDEEEALINSFYNNNNHSESNKEEDSWTNNNEQVSSDKKSEDLEIKVDERHPSERKGKNGVIHSDGKNKKNTGKNNNKPNENAFHKGESNNNGNKADKGNNKNKGNEHNK